MARLLTAPEANAIASGAVILGSKDEAFSLDDFRAGMDTELRVGREAPTKEECAAVGRTVLAHLREKADHYLPVPGGWGQPGDLTRVRPGSRRPRAATGDRLSVEPRRTDRRAGQETSAKTTIARRDHGTQAAGNRRLPVVFAGPGAVRPPARGVRPNHSLGPPARRRRGRPGLNPSAVPRPRGGGHRTRRVPRRSRPG
jgi:hypothetical protein